MTKTLAYKRKGLQILYQGGSHGAATTLPNMHLYATQRPAGRSLVTFLAGSKIPPGPPKFCVNGPAGAGKTAIAQKLCQICVEEKWLAGSFFFSRLALARGDAGRCDARRLLPTIAFQLAIAIPRVGNLSTASSPMILPSLRRNWRYSCRS